MSSYKTSFITSSASFITFLPQLPSCSPFTPPPAVCWPMDVTLANIRGEACKADFPAAIKCHCIIKTLPMTALRKTGAQLHLFIKIQEEQSFVREFSLLEMRLFHCLIQAWKSSFPTFSEEAVDPKPTWGGGVWMDPSQMGLIHHLSPRGRSTEKPSHVSQKKCVPRASSPSSTLL